MRFLYALATFVGIIVGWQLIDEFQGQREVAHFITDHKEVIAEKLRDPRVHVFELNPCPSDPYRLLVETDTDDRASLDRLEESLDGIEDLRFAPLWQWRIRSGEEPHRGNLTLRGNETFRTQVHIVIAAVVTVFRPFVVRRVQAFSARLFARRNSPAVPEISATGSRS